MGRKLILLADGTGNSARKLFKTNVWRMYQALDLSSARQSAYYSDGVGTSAFKPLALLGGVFGWGLKRNVLDLYTFLCRNYDRDAGDELYAFGFSRGAFTIRVLVRLVRNQGLIKDFNSSDDLWRQARYLYRDFRKSDERPDAPWITRGGRALRDWFLERYRPAISPDRRYPRFQFLGVWDTVDAYGLPINELKVGIDKHLWPLALGDRVLEGVNKACHALSIDEQRTTFRPLLWDETGRPVKDRTEEETLTQVWFAGVHANVGGGYPDDGLSSVALEWIIGEAKKRELQFDPTVEKEIVARSAPYGKAYNSRAYLQSYYRYGPRRVDLPTDNQGARVAHPKIHESVLWRMVAGTDAYAPLILPENLRVVSDVLSWPTDAEFDHRNPDRRIANQKSILSLNEYRAAVRARESRYFRPHATLAPPDDLTTALIWDTVWWRRVAYFVTLIVTMGLVAFPFLRHSFPGADGAPEWWLPKIFAAIAVPLASLLAKVLPAMAAIWLDALKASPGTFVLLSGVVVGCLLWGWRLERRIHDRALAAWNSTWRQKRARWFHDSLPSRATWADALAGLAIVGMFVVITYGYWLFTGECSSDRGCSATSMMGYGLLLGGLLLATSLLYLGGLKTSLVLQQMHRDNVTLESERRGFALGLAHAIRNNSRVNRIYNGLAEHVVPDIAAFVVGGGVVALVLFTARYLWRAATS